MWQALLTILVFMGWGLTWGAVLGALSGTLIFPGAGTFYATPWGAVMGLVMGAVTGVLAVISDRLFRREKMNLQGYRRKLAVVFGTLTAIGVPIMLIPSTHNFLWGYFAINELKPFLGLSLIAGVGWGGLGAAYTAVRHVDANISDALRGDRIDSPTVPLHLMWAAANRWTLLLGTVSGTLYILLTSYLPLFRRFTWGLALGFGVTIGDILLLGLANGFLILFFNRLYVKEYAPHLTLAQYKTRLSVLVFLFTLFAGFLVSAFVFVPISALIATLAARSYADWLYEGAEKFKRKPKESYDTARLEEADFEDDELADDTVYAEEGAGKV